MEDSSCSMDPLFLEQNGLQWWIFVTFSYILSKPPSWHRSSVNYISLLRQMRKLWKSLNPHTMLEHTLGNMTLREACLLGCRAGIVNIRMNLAEVILRGKAKLEILCLCWKRVNGFLLDLVDIWLRVTLVWDYKNIFVSWWPYRRNRHEQSSKIVKFTWTRYRTQKLTCRVQTACTKACAKLVNLKWISGWRYFQNTVKKIIQHHFKWKVAYIFYLKTFTRYSLNLSSFASQNQPYPKTWWRLYSWMWPL